MKYLFVLLFILLISCDTKKKKIVNFVPTHKSIKTKTVYEYGYKFDVLQDKKSFEKKVLYNKKGNLIEEDLGTMKYTHKFKNGVKTKSYLIDKEYFNEDTLNIYIHKYFKNNLINTGVYDHLGNQFAEFTYKYDADNHLIKKQYYHQGEMENSDTYHYNYKGKLLHTTHLGKYEITDFNHKYDSTGLITHSIDYNRYQKPKTMKKYEYTFYKK